MEKMWESEQPLQQLFIDLWQAYDCLSRDALRAMIELSTEEVHPSSAGHSEWLEELCTGGRREASGWKKYG